MHRAKLGLYAAMAGLALSAMPAGAQSVDNPQCPVWFQLYENAVQLYGATGRGTHAMLGAGGNRPMFFDGFTLEFHEAGGRRHHMGGPRLHGEAEIVRGQLLAVETKADLHLSLT